MISDANLEVNMMIRRGHDKVLNGTKQAEDSRISFPLSPDPTAFYRGSNFWSGKSPDLSGGKNKGKRVSVLLIRGRDSALNLNPVKTVKWRPLSVIVKSYLTKKRITFYSFVVIEPSRKSARLRIIDIRPQ